jgi:hypothetical protein
MSSSWRPPAARTRLAEPAIPEPYRLPVHLGVVSFPLRLSGLLALTLAITIPSCQAVFPQTSSANAPQLFSPGFFDADKK